MEEDKISVIVPAYNAEKTITKTLRSILGGGYRNVEVLVVDDGSTDKTKTIVKDLMLHDNRVKLITQSNSGVGVARCKGIQESIGEFIAFCDSDDWFEANYLQEHVKHLEKYKADISICRTQISNLPDIEYSDEISFKDKPDIVKAYVSYDGISVSLWDKVFRRKVLDTREILNDMRYSEDIYMNYIACKNADRIVQFNTTKYNWFNNMTSLSRGKFNPVKLGNDFEAWNKIIADCNRNYPELEETALLSSELWICGTYRLMVTHHYHNKKQEDMIAKYIRQDGLKVLKAEKNKRNKTFLRLAYMSFPFARGVWYFKNGCKTIVKKVIKK